MYVLTRCISYMILYPRIPMPEWCLSQAEELWTWSDTVRSWTNPYRSALLWNMMRNLWACTRCPLPNRQRLAGQGLARTTRQAVSPPQQGPGPPATALVGRAGTTLATTAPFLQHLQSPQPIWRVMLPNRGVPCFSAGERSCSTGLCSP